jgi:catechol 2,3-dioxygenase-like lactoylglutathione lyase family enzyme
MAHPFTIQGLDHVAIAVTDVARSAAWYQDVLGLERLHAGAWEVPTVVGAGSSGLALFPVQGPSPKPRPGRDVLTMRHVAFRVDAENYARAKAALSARGIAFEEQDHQIARSIYLHDPDGHEVELTTYV